MTKNIEAEETEETEELNEKYRYWANKAPEDLASEVLDRVEAYTETITKNGMLDLWRRTYCAYYNLDYSGGDHSGSQVKFAGDVGEIVLARAGHLRSLVQYLHVSATAQRLNYQPRAVNTDYKSKAQTYAAKSLLDYYSREKRLESAHKSAALRSLLYSIGYLWQWWDPTKGAVVMPEVDEEGNQTGGVKHEGDIVAKAKGPLDVIHDQRRGIHEQDWRIVRDPANKFDLAAKYPEKREKIIDSSGVNEEKQPVLFRAGFGAADDDDDKCEADDIYVFHFYHEKTPAMPMGRYFTCIDGETWLYDGPLPDEEVGVYPMYPDEFLETSWGYTSAWDLISNDELFNGILSTIATTVDAFGLPNIAVPDGSELTVEEVSGGLNLIHYPSGDQPPQVLEFSKFNDDLIKLLEFIQANSEVRSGVNSVARGQLDSNITSGTMAALVDAKAQFFNSSYERSYVALIEDSGTGLIRLFKRHAHVPRMIQIVGANGKGPVKQFSKDDVSEIDRVIVDAGNPLERTVAGKEAMAQTLSERYPEEMTPELYFEVLSTGRLDSRKLPHTITMDAIDRENELLASGKVTVGQTEDTAAQQAGQQPQVDRMTGAPVPAMREVIEEVPVLPTDNHRMHIFWHSVESTEPSERANAELLKIRMVHIRDHMWHLRFGDPMLQQVLGYAPQMPAGGPSPGGGGSPEGMPLAPEPSRPGGSAVPLPGQPEMPGNPAVM